MIAMKEVGQSYEKKRDVQVELYGNWTFDEANIWLENGINQVVYHRSRDAELAGKSWDEADMRKIDKLCKMGFLVTITGGLNKEDLVLFKDYPIHCIIGGRSIRNATNPTKAAKEFKEEIIRIWG
jgi:3-keto-L-gulonate-6-phosphate decarboxylase